MSRPGFDTSPLLSREFDKAEREYVKHLEHATDPADETELLIHTVKRIHKTPTAGMLLAAEQASGLHSDKVLEVWNAMWAKA